MRGLQDRGERIGATRVIRMAERVAELARSEVPGDLEVAREGQDVVLRGRRLRTRALDDARLRGLGPMLRSMLR